jgi:hypothetical protein
LTSCHGFYAANNVPDSTLYPMSDTRFLCTSQAGRLHGEASRTPAIRRGWLTLLCTWLGHVHPGSTYWYLSASPELMAVAGTRLEQHLAERSGVRR